jgi:hypothetical protein
MIIFSRTDGDFCHRGRDTEIAQKNLRLLHYWHDHSLESSQGAVSDGTISFSIHILGDWCVFWIFLKKSQSLKSQVASDSAMHF